MPTVLDTSGLVGFADALATGIAALLIDAGRPVELAGSDLPIPAAPAGDTCSQVSVCVEGLTRMDTYTAQQVGINQQGHWAVTGTGRFLVGYSISIIRCTGTDPNTGQLADHDSVTALGSDLWLVANWLKQGHQTGSLFDSDDEWFFDGAVPIHNQGNYAGYQLAFRVPFDALPYPLEN